MWHCPYKIYILCLIVSYALYKLFKRYLNKYTFAFKYLDIKNK